jgi:hypothetical protein
MPIGNPQTLKERVDVLERNMLAIDCLSNLCTATVNSNGDIGQSDMAFLLAYLSEDSMYKVEALRMMIDALPAATAAHVPRTRERRKKSTLAAVA